MILSGAIMAHPVRANEVEHLLATLDRDLPVCWDPDTSPPSGSGDRVWTTARSAWMAFNPDADWHVLIQDDAIVSKDFMSGLQRALAHVPGACAVSPYLGQGRNVPARWGKMATKADQLGASWVVSDRLMWGVCLALPTACVPAMVAWCDRRPGIPDDMRVSGWVRHQRWETWYPWPSLVDHRRGASLTKHRAADRTAARWHSGSALEVNWSGRTVVDPMLTRRRPTVTAR